MTKRFQVLVFAVFGLAALSGTVLAIADSGSSPKPKPQKAQKFNDYWFSGVAEVSSYELQQARYGQLHEGHASLIFVTENFRPEKQVKDENNDDGGIPVLKLNFVKKFTTGIYPYSMMMSVFTPTTQRKQYPRSLKISVSEQDWCGHMYSQLNYRKKGYKLTGHSYFESEADYQKKLGDFLAEDELWTLLRMDPQALPTGQFQMVPNQLYCRLLHKHNKATQVKAQKTSTTWEGQQLQAYTVEYPEFERELTIYYQKDFPHRIEGWEETYPSLPVNGKGKLTTKAVRKKTLRSDYWSKNAKKDAKLRQQLGI